jgi:Ca2+-transporting ATPase
MDGYTRLNYYRQSPAEVLDELKATPDGLKPKEAATRLEHNGPNSLRRAHRDSTLLTFLHQFKNVLVVILLVRHSRSTCMICERPLF